MSRLRRTTVIIGTLLSCVLIAPTSAMAAESVASSGSGPFDIRGDVDDSLRALARACAHCTWQTWPTCSNDGELCADLALGCPHLATPRILRIEDRGRVISRRICAQAITPMVRSGADRSDDDSADRPDNGSAGSSVGDGPISQVPTPSIRITPEAGLLVGRPVLAQAVIPGFRGRQVAPRCRWFLEQRVVATTCEPVTIRPQARSALRLEVAFRLPGRPDPTVRTAVSELIPGTIRPVAGPGPDHR